MGINNKEQSLKIVFLKYLINIALGLVLAIGLSILILYASYEFGIIVPANNTENILLEEKDNISKIDKFEKEMLPNNTNYMLISEEGKVIDSNMSKETEKTAIAFHNKEGVSNSDLSFMEIKRYDEYVIISYSLKPYYTNSWLQEHFPKINNLFIGILIIFCFFSTFLITVFWAKKLTKELTPMLYASEKISQQNLNFKIGRSKISEFNEVLHSLEKMQKELSKSLRKNWEEEENKQNRILALTHDLKTPISIVQGNAELLIDTKLSDEQKTYVDFIIKNTGRISNYTNTLMLMNKSSKLKEFDMRKVNISIIINKTLELAREVTLIHKIKLSESVNVDKNKEIMIDIVLFERVIQNILSNSIQYSKEKSTIKVNISTANDMLKISILDNGIGFSNEDLINASIQFYRGDKSRHSSTNYGIGLYTAKKIIEIHGGKLIIYNRSDIEGAGVTISLPLIKNK